ncbi:MAG: three-Cys-motif partner protein TcmP [Chitinophagaceae bacterium]
MTPAEEKNFGLHKVPESRIKALLVSDYFPQYCRIVDRGKGQGFTYVDLWAGRGKYDNGGLSTPLLLADIIVKDDYLRQKVKFAFNDLNNIDTLKKNFEDRYEKGIFTKEPWFGKLDAENCPQIRRYLNRPPKKDNDPALLFFDPFGYAGIDTKSLANFMKPWGNELFLFLNVNRVIPALTNPKVTEHIAAMFPQFKEQAISEVTSAISDEKRVSLLLKFLTAEFKAVIGSHLQHCSFRFMESGAHKTSHLIIHFTKHSTGYKLIKQVYYDYDNIGAVLNSDGTFTFDAKKAYPTGVLDFSMDDNHLNLAKDLAKQFAGTELTAAALIDQHHPNTLYAPTHYVKALRYLVEQEGLQARFTDGIEHKRTVLPSKYCLLKFPPSNG